MELPSIGNHCSILECKQLDFLPLKCESSNHFKSEHHECHSVSKFTENPEFSQPNFKCPIVGCQEKGTIGSDCPNCLETYCLKHRTPKSHTCDIRPVMIKRAEEDSIAKSKKLDIQTKLLEKVKQTAEPSTNSNAKPKLKFSGNNSLPPTIVKTLAKQKAKGDSSISMPVRIYIEVAAPLSSSIAPQYMFFDENLALGKAVDSITSIMKIALDCSINGVAKRLMLFDGTIGKQIPIAFNTLTKVSKEYNWNHKDLKSNIPKIIAEYVSPGDTDSVDPESYFNTTQS